jgi:nucleoside-diphosphate-sugar epimerase
MKVLVTGGTGFVGSHLLATLVQQGITPRALVRSPAKAKSLQLDGVEWVPGDLGDAESLRRATQGVEVVFHLAGLVAARDEAEYRRVNVAGTRLLLDVVAERSLFILVSSLAAAGPAAPGQPRRGDEVPQPVTAYGRSKLAAESLVRTSRVPWIIVRPPVVYGPRDTQLLRLFRAARFGIAPVFGRGEQELSLVYGPDLARMLVLAAVTPAAVGQVLYAAHPEVVTQAEFVRCVGHAVGQRVRLVRIPVPAARAVLAMTGAVARLSGRATLLNPDKGRELFQPAWTCDPTLLERTVGWRAEHDLARGAVLTAEWYRQHGWL